MANRALLGETAFSDRDMETMGEIFRGIAHIIKGEGRDRLIGGVRRIGVVETYLRHLGTTDPNLLLKAIANLSLFGDRQVAGRLFAVLEDRRPALRLAAAQALADMGAEFSLPDLVSRLEIGTVVTSRSLRGLFERLAQDRVADLIKMAGTAPDEQVLLLVVYGLGRSHDYQVLPTLLALMDSEFGEVRAEVLRALAVLGHPSALPAVENGLGDPAWEVRLHAALCAGRVGLGELVPRLGNLLEDGEWWVRYRAAQALLRLGQEGKSVLEAAARQSTVAASVAGLAAETAQGAAA